MSTVSNVLYLANIREMGRADAREWLADPQAYSLIDLRLDFQDKLTESIAALEMEMACPEFGPNTLALVTAEGILDELNEYSSGVDEVLTAFVFAQFNLGTPEGGWQ